MILNSTLRFRLLSWPLAFVSLAFVGLLCSHLRAAESEGPNIVLIVADDLGYGELGCYGQRIIETPHIDRLAHEGMRFRQFYSGSPVCAPSRCVLMTGLHSGHAPIRTNREVRPEGQHPLPAETVTLAELLQAEGYVTGAMGKWGLGPPGSTGDPLQHGFTHFFGYNCQRHAHNHYPAFLYRNAEKVFYPGNTGQDLTGSDYSQDLFMDEAVAFLERHREQPFLLYLPLIIPHLSIQVPEATLAKYRGKIPEEAYRHTSYLRHSHPRAGYAAMATHMDAGVGRLLAKLAELELDENTVVFFTSDNGPTFDRLGGSDSDFFDSSGPFRGRKGSVYEGGIRVPLVARWPGKIEAGQVTDHIAAFQDFLPTLMQLCGAAERIPETIDGIGFQPTLLSLGDQPRHEYLYMEFPSYGSQQMVRLGNWKGVRRGMARGNLDLELYLLDEDPREKDNVAGQHPEIVSRLEAIMREEHVPSADFPLPGVDTR